MISLSLLMPDNYLIHLHHTFAISVHVKYHELYQSLSTSLLGPVYMEWGTPVKWGWFLLFSRSGDTKQKKPTPLDRGPPLHVNRPLMSDIYLLLHHKYVCKTPRLRTWIFPT